MLKAQSALAGFTSLPHTGSGTAEPGVTLAELPAGTQIAVLARKGQSEALAARLSALGFALPLRPARIEAGTVTILATGPGQWLVLGPAAEADTLLRTFGAFTALCTTVRADDARTLLSVAGPRAADALAKVLPIDLHPRAFGPDHAATTVAGGIAVQVWRRPEGGFGCAVPRSLARAMWSWLASAAAEYGLVETIDEG